MSVSVHIITGAGAPAAAQSNGLVESEVEKLETDKKGGGAQNRPESAIIINESALRDGGSVIITAGGIGFADLFDTSGSTINALLATYVRTVRNQFVNPFLENKIEETVKPNITGDNRDAFYLPSITNISFFLPEENKPENTWTTNELIADFTLKSLGSINRGLQLFIENEDCKQEVAVIAQRVRDELNAKIISQTALMVDVKATATVDLRYIFYVEKYGLPPGGIFDPVKLAEFL